MGERPQRGYRTAGRGGVRPCCPEQRGLAGAAGTYLRRSLSAADQMAGADASLPEAQRGLQARSTASRRAWIFSGLVR